MLDVFEKIKDPRLTGFIVWEPMLPGDSALDAAELISNEPRFVMQGWDARRSLGDAFENTLHLNRPAWDVYLIYEPGIKWIDDAPPVPSFWMHQLSQKSGADPALHLNPLKFQHQVEQRLKSGTTNK